MSAWGVSLLVVVVALVAGAVGAMAMVWSNAYPTLAGLWTLSAGSKSSMQCRLSPWRVLIGAHFMPRYEARGCSSDLAATLTKAAGPISVESAAATCQLHSLRCELSNLDGEPIAVIEPDGTVRVYAGKHTGG